ncbi:hypothetical protein E2R57_03985 [Arthrobacter nitrophenolicus]|uniref:Uncharacterized protein n=1 Tax=Arthrobacter nitrophenolicus TaxID=683150 RepID=A0A4R5Y8E2_9MICC|nr:hypothetical protein E2R57_03985 [Arthrobacter nitrophenolicus]
MRETESWARLVGAFVEIRQNHRSVRSGIVEHAMPDSSLLWLAADAINQRAMFAAADNYEVWVHPRPLAAPVRFG